MDEEKRFLQPTVMGRSRPGDTAATKSRAKLKVGYVVGSPNASAPVGST